jgi:hypothetical protein
LLVYRWAVHSDATVKLIMGAVGRTAADKPAGHAEALRQSMLALIYKGKSNEAHPNYWTLRGGGRGGGGEVVRISARAIARCTVISVGR